MKKQKSLNACLTLGVCWLVIIPFLVAPAFANENAGAYKGKAYENDFSLSHNNNEQTIIVSGVSAQVPKALYARSYNPDGHGLFTFGVGGIARYHQYSRYDNSKKTHSTTSMMNNQYARSGWVSKGKRASAKTGGHWSYRTNNSYYDYK